MPHTDLNDIWITEVEVVNFQSLKHIVVKLINGSNAFVGSSNSGKTACIRAIRWCLLNDRKGDKFITRGQKEAMVKVSLSNGKVIERRKSKSNVNLYRVYDNGEMVGDYTGFGTSVPEEVVEAHGIRPISGDIYFQFSQQLESAFLLSLRPSKRADVLGSMEELKRIDTALLGINDDIRQSNKRDKELKKNSKQVKKDILSLETETQRVSAKIEALKSLQQGLQSKFNLRTYLIDRLERLREIQTIVKEVDTQLQKSNRIIKAWPSDLEARVSTFTLLVKHANRLKEIKEELQTIKFMKDDQLQELERLNVTIEKKIKDFKAVSLAAAALKQNESMQEETKNSYSQRVASLDMHPIEKEIGKYQLLFHHIDRLRQIDKSIEETDQIVKTANENIDSMLNQITEALHQAEICPTCGQGTHEVCPETIEAVL